MARGHERNEHVFVPHSWYDKIWERPSFVQSYLQYSSLRREPDTLATKHSRRLDSRCVALYYHCYGGLEGCVM